MVPTLAMHAPDGFLEPTVAIATAIISAMIIAVALKRSNEQLGDRQIPLAGLTAAFIFAVQMVNFPVASGTSGHLLGGALAAILLGPWVGSLVVSIVVIVQALVFADGGLTALGYNILNMAIITAFGGWAVFQLLRRILPANRAGISAAAGLAAGASVVLSSAAFSLEWLFGASAPVPFDRVFTAMVGVHVLIGIGEGLITAAVVATVAATRPDLIAGASDLPPKALADKGARIDGRVFALASIGITVVVAAIIAQFASNSPDGLEKVAENEGFIGTAKDHAFGSSLFADYATSGISNETLSLAIAGVTGVAITLLMGYGLATSGRLARTTAR